MEDIMKICEVCGNEENNKSKFCSKCGGGLKSDNGKIKVKKKHCPKCNKHFELEKEYCSDCGTKLEKVETEEKKDGRLKKNIKNKKKKRLIIILSSIVIILVAIFFIGVQEQQRQEEAKKEYFTTYSEIMSHIYYINLLLDLDASRQREIFRKKPYRDSSGAVIKYSEENGTFEESYEDRTKKIEDLINKELLKNRDLLSGDAEYKKLNKLLDKTIADLNSYLEDTMNPTGTYYTYTDSSNKKSKKLSQSYLEMETELGHALKANGLTFLDISKERKTKNK